MQATALGGEDKASLLWRTQIISVLRLALLQMNLLAHPKKTKNYATQNTHKFNFNAISVPWCLSLRCPKEVGDLTMCGHKASQSENNKLIKSFKLHERVKCNKG